jgi:AraC-like DNA-binding protein
MDPLSDVLRDAGLRRRLLDQHGLDATGAVRFPCERSIGFHVVLRGQAWVHGPDLDAPLALGPGEVALMARGCQHVLAASARLPAGDIPVAGLAEGPVAAAPDAACVVVSGAYQFWNAPVHPLFADLPAWTRVRAGEDPAAAPLGALVPLLAAEAARDAPGAEAIVHGLLDAAFVYLLRAALADATRCGWGRGIGDARVRRAIGSLHAQPARDWTLDALAREAGLSRSALAQHFRAATGETPLNYLRTLRMQRAMRLLGESARPLESVAAEVGYQDAFGFSRVFKRVVGLSPSAFRRRDADDRASPMRL